MAIQLVFLRGVMPSGKNRVPMKDLQALLRENGFPNARTYLHTGNLILESTETPEHLAHMIHELILKHIGPDLGIIVRTPQQVSELLSNNPFTAPAYDLKRVFFAMLDRSPQAAAVDTLTALVEGTPEKLQIINDTAYLYLPGNAARSKLSNNLLERKLDLVSTSRNSNTLTKVLAIAASFPS